ncbi:MAG TPA: hypothetical protein VF875_07420, partial [Anaeromyxobacter sp.]
MTSSVSAAKPRSASRAPWGAARVRLAALVGLAALAACGSKTATSPIANLAEPTAVAVFRGVTSAHGTADRPGHANPYSPHLAVANAQTDDLTIVDAVTDAVLPSPVPLHGLVYPFAFRPALVVAADLGDGKPDLLVGVSGGDSKLKLVRTWEADGAIVAELDLYATVVALLALPPDPGVPGTARLVAALAGGQIAVATFERSVSGDGTGIHVDVAGPPQISADLGFQAVDLAVLPGDHTRVWAATPDPIPLGGVQGVAGIDVTGTPSLAVALDALAPTRAVAAARLVEALDPTALGTAAFDGQPTVDRIYAVLDERGCGFYATIACGLVALDPAAVGVALRPDPTPAPFFATYQAPIQLGYALGVATSGPPAQIPDDADPFYAGTYLRIVTTAGTRASTAVAGATSSDGALTFLDLSRWEIPSHVPVHANVKA